jgi:hypothetical protein
VLICWFGFAKREEKKREKYLISSCLWFCTERERERECGNIFPGLLVCREREYEERDGEENEKIKNNKIIFKMIFN